MNKRLRTLFWILLVVGVSLPCYLSAEVALEPNVPQLAFAAQELEDAVDEWKAYSAVLTPQYKTQIGAIDLKVGNVSKSRKDAWEDEIHAVILNEGETFADGDIREFPRLNCYLRLADDGSLALNSGTPGNNEGRIWGTNGKANRPKPHPVPFRFYIAVVEGQMRIYREKPGYPKVVIYRTRSAPGPGSCKLGISASKRLAVYGEANGKRKTVWMSPKID